MFSFFLFSYNYLLQIRKTPVFIDMDSNNNDNDKKPVRIKKLRKCIVDAAPHIKLKRRETEDSDMDSIQSQV